LSATKGGETARADAVQHGTSGSTQDTGLSRA
jgi:hypothetical protein